MILTEEIQLPSAIADDFLERYASILLEIMHEREHDSRVNDLCVCRGENAVATYRCIDCFQQSLLCGACIAEHHRNQPFHRINEWTAPGYFKQTSLTKVGYVLRIGHGGDLCSYYGSQHRADLHAVTVLHTNGIHEMEVQFCRCGSEVDFKNGGPNSPFQSLWRAGLWPATYASPASAATSAVLEVFRLLCVEAKVTATAFFTFLRRLTAVVFEEESRVRRQLINRAQEKLTNTVGSIARVLRHVSSMVLLVHLQAAQCPTQTFTQKPRRRKPRHILPSVSSASPEQHGT